MATLTEIVDVYCAAWNAPDPQRRRELLEQSVPVTVRYTDRGVDVTGLDALADHLGAVLERRPGAQVLRTSEVDAHHAVARFDRHVVRDGSELVRGVDFVDVDADGRLARVVGFLTA